MAEDQLASARRSLGRLGLVGFVIAIVLIGGLGTWAATTEVAGAVVAGGSIVVEGGTQRVQHPEGGVVREIFVRNDDPVEIGQVLVRLDGTTIEATLAVIDAQLDDAYARQTRLVAEADGQTVVAYPSVVGWRPGQGFDAVFKRQVTLFQSRAASIAGQQGQLEEQNVQANQQIVGLEAQRSSLREQLTILQEEWVSIDELLDSGLTNIERANNNKSRRSSAEGEIARIGADIAAVNATIAERSLQATQLLDEFRAKVLEELQQVNVSIAELQQQRIAAADRLIRLEIRAPQAGVVHESKVQTVGGVVAAGDTIMLIVPHSRDVLVDTHVSPIDIDKVFQGQPVVLRLSSFDSRTTPELAAAVRDIAPTTSTDPATGATYYTVRVAAGADEVARLPANTALVPGMPAEVFIQTGDRTVMAYLMKPLMDQIAHTFRQD